MPYGDCQWRNRFDVTRYLRGESVCSDNKNCKGKLPRTADGDVMVMELHDCKIEDDKTDTQDLKKHRWDIKMINLLLTAWHGNAFHISGFVRGIHRSPLRALKLSFCLRDVILGLIWYLVRSLQMRVYYSTKWLNIQLLMPQWPILLSRPSLALKMITRAYRTLIRLYPLVSITLWGFMVGSMAVWEVWNQQLFVKMVLHEQVQIFNISIKIHR